MATKAPKKAPKRQRLTAKQRKLALLLPEVEGGKMTMVDAMRKAGYAESSAHGQTTTLCSLRNNEQIQEALRKAGVTMDVIAEKIEEGLSATSAVPTKTGIRYEDDYNARHKYVKTAAELLDAFPSKKIEDVTPPIAYDELERPPKANSPEEARKMAEK